MNKITFATIETDSRNGVERKLLHSSAINNITIDVVGRGVKWEGFVTKFKVLEEYLPQVKTDLVCITDSRDVLYMSNAETIYRTFVENFKSDSIVYNAETNCYPDSSLEKDFPHSEKKYRYLNSGCVIGNKDVLLEVVKEAINLNKQRGLTDDQEILQHIFLFDSNYPSFTLDYDCKIFQCVWDEDWGRSNNFDLIYTRDSIYNRLTDTYPLIFHFPGPTTTDSQVWKILNGTYNRNTNNKFF